MEHIIDRVVNDEPFTYTHFHYNFLFSYQSHSNLVASIQLYTIYATICGAVHVSIFMLVGECKTNSRDRRQW